MYCTHKAILLIIQEEIVNWRSKTFCSGSWPRIYRCRS